MKASCVLVVCLSAGLSSLALGRDDATRERAQEASELAREHRQDRALESVREREAKARKAKEAERKVKPAPPATGTSPSR